MHESFSTQQASCYAYLTTFYKIKRLHRGGSDLRSTLLLLGQFAFGARRNAI